MSNAIPAVKRTFPSASSAASKKRRMPTKMKKVPKDTSPAPISVFRRKARQCTEVRIPSMIRPPYDATLTLLICEPHFVWLTVSDGDLMIWWRPGNTVTKNNKVAFVPAADYQLQSCCPRGCGFLADFSKRRHASYAPRPSPEDEHFFPKPLTPSGSVPRRLPLSHEQHST